MPKKEVSSEERLNIAISLVTLLLNQDELALDAAANHFEVSVKTLRDLVRTMNEAEDIRRFTSFFYIDVDLLEEEGVLRLLEAQALRELPKLTKQQAMALSAGINYLAGLPHFSVDPELQSLREVLAESNPPHYESPNAIEARTHQIQTGITGKRVIQCRYVNQSGESRTRRIQPLRIDFVSARYYLRGVCEDSRMLKSFRLDRMSEIVVTTDTIPLDSLSLAIPNEIYGDNPGEIEVTVRLRPDARDFLWGYPLTTRVSSQGDTLEATIVTGNLHTLGRQVLRYGGKVEVISPADARAAVRIYAERIASEAATTQDPDAE